MSWVELYLTLLSALVLGSYGFALWVFGRLDGKIDAVVRNHVQHLEARLGELEDRHGEGRHDT